MKKRFFVLSLLIIAVAAALFSLSSCRKLASAADKAVGNYIYKADPSGGITIVKYVGKFTQIEIPEEIDGHTVKSISENAFSAIPGIKSVVIPQTVEKIYSGVFDGCLALQSVTLKAPIVYIHDNAFKGCVSLTKVKSDGYISYIGNGAFYECTTLEAVKSELGIVRIGDSAFYGCSALRSIDISKDVSYISSSAFTGCNSLNYGEYGNCLYLGNDKNPFAYLLDVKGSTITSCSVHKDTEIIMPGVFAKCTALNDIQINALPTNDAYIGFGQNVASPTQTLTVTLGKDLQRVPTEFLNLPFILNGVNTLVFEDGMGVSGMSKINFYDFNKLEYLFIPTGITSIGDYTFMSCTRLKQVYLPEGVTYIGIEAFGGCTGLRYVNIPSTVNIIGELAFKNCSSLTELVVPPNAVIGKNAFEGCTNLGKDTEDSTNQDSIEAPIIDVNFD